MTKIGELVVEMKLANGQLVQGVNETNQKLGGLEKGVGGVNSTLVNLSTGLSVAHEALALVQDGFDQTIGGMIKFSDQLDDASDVTGISVENLQRLRAGGIAVGVGFDSTLASIKMFSQKIEEGGAAGEELRQRLSDIGVSLTDVNGNVKDNYTVWMETVKALGEVENVNERNNLSVALLGRSYSDVAGIMKNYAAFSQAAASADPISESQIKRAHDLGIELDKANEKWAAMERSIGDTLIPAFAAATDGVSKFFDKVATGSSNWMRVIGNARAWAANPAGGTNQYGSIIDAIKVNEVIQDNNAASGKGGAGPAGVPGTEMSDKDLTTYIKDLKSKYSELDSLNAYFRTAKTSMQLDKDVADAKKKMEDADKAWKMNYTEENKKTYEYEVEQYNLAINSKMYALNDYKANVARASELMKEIAADQAKAEVSVNKTKNAEVKKEWDGLKSYIESHPTDAVVRVTQFMSTITTTPLGAEESHGTTTTTSNPIDWMAKYKNLAAEYPGLKVTRGSVDLYAARFSHNEQDYEAIHRWQMAATQNGGVYPAYARGGIALSPQVATVAENGPEAIIPLSQMGAFGSGEHVIVIELDSHEIARAIVPLIPGEVRLRTGLHI